MKNEENATNDIQKRVGVSKSLSHWFLGIENRKADLKKIFESEGVIEDKLLAEDENRLLNNFFVREWKAFVSTPNC